MHSREFRRGWMVWEAEAQGMTALVVTTSRTGQLLRMYRMHRRGLTLVSKRGAAMTRSRFERTRMRLDAHRRRFGWTSAALERQSLGCCPLRKARDVRIPAHVRLTAWCRVKVGYTYFALCV